MHEFWKVLQNKQNYRKNMQIKFVLKSLGAPAFRLMRFHSMVSSIFILKKDLLFEK